MACRRNDKRRKYIESVWFYSWMEKQGQKWDILMSTSAMITSQGPINIGSPLHSVQMKSTCNNSLFYSYI